MSLHHRLRQSPRHLCLSFIDSLDIKPKPSRTNGKNRDGKSDKDKPDRHGEDDIKLFDIGKCIQYIILVLIVGIIVWFFFFMKDSSGNTFTGGDTTPDTTGVFPPRSDGGATGGGNPYPPLDINNLYIDIAEFTGSKNYMEENSAYTIRICDKISHNLIDGIKGSWIIQDTDFNVGDSTHIETMITPIRKGKDLLVQFCIEGLETTPLERKIKVK